MDKRTELKAFIRGVEAGSFAGVPIKYWLIIENDIYNNDVINCCKGILSKYNQETGSTLKRGVFYEYLKRHK